MRVSRCVFYALSLLAPLVFLSIADADIMIVKIFFSEPIPGDAGEAIALSHSGTTPLSLGGYEISNLSPEGRGGAIVLPENTSLAAGKIWWIARNAVAFEREFGFYPDCEISRSVPTLQQASVRKRWPSLSGEKDVVILKNAQTLIDTVAYNNTALPFPLNLSTSQWEGAAIPMKTGIAYPWKHLILSRDQDKSGRFIDTNHASDWDGGFSRTKLGSDAFHRLYAPAQSELRPVRLLLDHTPIKAAVAPESNFALLTEAIDAAGEEIQIGIYEFDHPTIASHLVKALKRGVSVKMLIEGEPVGGISEATHTLLEYLCENGAEITSVLSEGKTGFPRRYRYMHAKYTIIDRRHLIVGSENYSETGHSTCGEGGNRGWEIKIESAALADFFLSLLSEDHRLTQPRDTLSFCEPLSSIKEASLPEFPSAVCSSESSLAKKNYTLTLPEPGTLLVEPVIAPDFSLYEEGGLLRAIREAKRSILVQQMSLSNYWGRKTDTPSSAPNLLLASLLEAAHRGVAVKILLDSMFFNVDPDYRDPRDNDDSVAWINRQASSLRLPIEARLIDLRRAPFLKIHNKGVLIDEETVFIGSLNWVENSAKRNREAGVLITHPEIGAFYKAIFEGDWRLSTRSLSRRDRFPSIPNLLNFLTP